MLNVQTLEPPVGLDQKERGEGKKSTDRALKTSPIQVFRLESVDRSTE